MKNLIVHLSVILLLLLSACKQQENDRGGDPLISFHQTEFLDFSPLIEDIRYSFIEPTPESIFIEPSKMMVFNGLVYILDKRMESVLCVDTTGKFKFKICSVGKGPWEYQELDAMWINPDTKELWLQSYIPSKFMVFELDGTRKREFTFSWSTCDMARVGDNLLVAFNQFRYVKERDSMNIGIYLLNEKGQQKKELITFGDTTWINGLILRRSLAETDNGVLVINQSDTIYRISRDGKLSKDFVADFGRYKLPVNYRQLYSGPGVTKMFNSLDYLFLKDEMVAFGPIRLFKAFIGKSMYYAMVDVSQGIGTFSTDIRHDSGILPILIPDCVTDRGEMAGILNMEMLWGLKEALAATGTDSKSKDLLKEARELIDQGIANDRPILFFAPIKKQWLNKKE